ncbi:MAG: hypothetical protein ACJ8AW_28630 [Rhodopila sp.]|jgi:hypothetical protein
MLTATTTSATGPVPAVSRSAAASSEYLRYGRAATMNGSDFGAPSLLYGDVNDDSDDLSSAKGLIFGSAMGLVLWLPIVAYFFR